MSADNAPPEASFVLSSLEWGQNVSFIVPGTPMTQLRPSPSFLSRKLYDPKICKERKQHIARVVQSSLAVHADGRSSMVFSKDDRLLVQVKFMCRRPKSDFKNEMRGAGRLRAVVASRRLDYPKNGDLDNYIKLILDALNKVVYPDDKAICALLAIKVYDNEGQGSTQVSIRKIAETQDLEALVMTGF